MHNEELNDLYCSPNIERAISSRRTLCLCILIVMYEGWSFNLLKPNDIYICRTAALTSRRYVLNIYSTNIHTEYFKHAA